ncbi:uncharacterized protein LOC114749656 [Neltuma alba]|uniref:uncharacterized protein LOC114749656 n=1 Tax=Neltuma alba TaxID=207710 RepID=UPI0010A3FB97|nr:uncharacterized protein LOC114749656 [Prosopis alba]
MRAAQARQEQERDATIAVAVAAALANLERRQPEEEVSAAPASEQLPRPVMPAAEPDSIQQWMTRFCKHNPPSFDGTFDVEAAEEWINRLEKIFKVMDCSLERKTQMTIYKLEKDADRWWKNTEILLNARNTTVTWEVFLEQLYEKYFPRSVCDEREAEFLTLKQKDDEPFDEYLAKFILEACRITESSFNHHLMVKTTPRAEKGGQGGQGGTSSNVNKKRKQPWNNHKNKKGGKAPKGKECAKCGKNHGDRPCIAGQNVCYTCGKPRHFSRECPQNTEQARPRT